MDIVRIQADDREKQSGMVDLLQLHPQFDLSIKRMCYGDYLVDGWLIVERKQINDLLVSIIDGRLFHQAKLLAQSPYKSLLIIEGRASDIQNSKIDRRVVLGALASIGLSYGVGILRSFNQLETVNVMLYAAQQKSRIEKNVTTRVYRGGYRPKSPQKQQLYLLQGLPGVGRKLAINLLSHFGCVGAVMRATEKELQAVEGVGEGKAADIIKILK